MPVACAFANRDARADLFAIFSTALVGKGKARERPIGKRPVLQHGAPGMHLLLSPGSTVDSCQPTRPRQSPDSWTVCPASVPDNVDTVPDTVPDTLDRHSTGPTCRTCLASRLCPRQARQARQARQFDSLTARQCPRQALTGSTGLLKLLALKDYCLQVASSCKIPCKHRVVAGVLSV